MSLEQEAKEYTEKKKAASPKMDKTAFRFYSGHAFSTLISMYAGQPREEVIRQAFHWGKAMAELEKEFV